MAGLVVIGGALVAPALQLLRWDPGDADWFGGFPQGAENAGGRGRAPSPAGAGAGGGGGPAAGLEHVAGVVELASRAEQLDVRWFADGGIEGIDATVGPADGPVDAIEPSGSSPATLGLRPEQVRVSAAEHGGQGRSSGDGTGAPAWMARRWRLSDGQRRYLGHLLILLAAGVQCF